VIITKRGKPAARLLPIEIPSQPADDFDMWVNGQPFFGRGKGTGVTLGDIVGPTGERWDAQGYLRVL
jgi:antitoxin (DNA-binding transcriptional repressor) of toxin-antitoxin stability system